MDEQKQSASLLSDRAAENDLLDFSPYTNTLLDIIRDPNTQGPLVIGLFGSWGSGKTSLMQFVQKDLGDAAKNAGRNFRTVWFDAWKYEKEDALWRALLLRVLDSLSDQDDIKTSAAMKKEIQQLEKSLYHAVEWEEKGGMTIDLPKLGKAAAGAAIKLSFSMLPGFAADAVKAAQEALGKGEDADKLFDAFQREVVKHRQEQLRSIEQFQEKFQDLVQRHIVDKSERLVIFVDDLDRCLPEKAIEVLEAIKLFLDVKGCIFLLGLDQDVVTRGIKVKYREFAVDDGATERKIPIDGAAYLEKIIQLPFRLPKIEPRDMSKFVTGMGVTFPDARCAQVFAEGLETNPRKVKRAINIFLFISKLAEKRGILIQAVRLAKIVVIYHSYTLLYDRLNENPALLPLLEEYYRKPEAQTPRELIGRPRAEEIEGAADTAKQVMEPPAAFAGLLKPELKNVMTLFLTDPTACFTEKDEKGIYLDFSRYFRLTRGTIAETPVAATAETAARVALAFPVPTFIRVPAGEFLMGTSDAEIEQLLKMKETQAFAKEWKEKGNFKREQPQHRVVLDEFQIGKYPVTNAEYLAFVKDANQRPPSHWSGGTFPEELSANPVVNVSWDDAQAYCKWLTQKLLEAHQLRDKEIIRLPTEAEWEKAARGPSTGSGDGRFWPWGNQWDAAKCNSSEGGAGTTTPVGKYSPAGDSPYGAADMAGNVWEWCADWYAEDYYKNSPDALVRNPTGASSGEYRVLRGGSWFFVSFNVRAAFRFWDGPVSGSGGRGFRVVVRPLSL